jgi:hypothetical protein
MTGEKVPNWNQRARSSLKPGLPGSPEWKPPMSEFHQGMPDMAMERPFFTLTLRFQKVLAMSPFQTQAPKRWLPGYAARVRMTISSSPSDLSPSQKALARK